MAPAKNCFPRSKGADGTDEEFAKVIAYLTANMGKKDLSAAEPPTDHFRSARR